MFWTGKDSNSSAPFSLAPMAIMEDPAIVRGHREKHSLFHFNNSLTFLVTDNALLYISCDPQMAALTKGSNTV